MEKIFHVFKHLPKIMQPIVEGPKDNYHKENVYNKSKKFLYINFYSYINKFFLLLLN